MSFFTLKPGRSIWIEIMNQFLHVFLAALYMILFVLKVPVEAAAALSFGFGMLRELEQHQWRFMEIGRQDLFFWGSSCILFTLVYYVVVELWA